MATATPEAAKKAAQAVARGMAALIASRFLTVPVSIAINIFLARNLGASDFGAIYLASAGLSLAFLFVEFGTGSQAAAEVARDPARAPRVLGGALLLRLVGGLLVLAAVPPVTRLLGYSETVRMVFMLTALRSLVFSGGAVASAVVRGLERISLHARLTVLCSVADAAILIPTLLLGGGLRAALIAQLASATVGLAAWLIALARLRAMRMEVDRSAVASLLRGGLGFVSFDLALRLQPWLDANFLDKLATPDAVGWYAAANRMLTALLLPVTALNFAIYPTMARLWVSDRDAYARLTRVGIRMVLFFGMMAAVGSIAYADLAVGLMYGSAFAPAARDLQVLAGFIALVYMTMLFGCAIGAAGRQLAWAGVQALCIPVSLIADPLLIPRFQRATGNGGLGVCVAVLGAEVLMVAGGLLILPRIVLARSLLVDAGRTLAAGAAMGLAAFLLRAIPAVSIPVSLAAYLGTQAALGGLDSELVAQIRATAASKLGRTAAAPSLPG